MCLRWLTLILQHRWLLLESSSALSPLVCFWVPLGRDLQMRCTPFTDVIHSYEHICHHDIHSGFCTRTCFARCFSSIDKARSIGLCIRETFMTEHLPNTFRLFLKKKKIIDSQKSHALHLPPLQDFLFGELTSPPSVFRSNLEDKGSNKSLTQLS